MCFPCIFCVLTILDILFTVDMNALPDMVEPNAQRARIEKKATGTFIFRD